MAGAMGAMVMRGVCSASMMPGDAWLAAVWEAVRGQLPVPPASVVEVGCGPLGGLVPVLRSAGYAATGVDPAAPRGSWYCPVEFERFTRKRPGPERERPGRGRGGVPVDGVVLVVGAGDRDQVTGRLSARARNVSGRRVAIVIEAMSRCGMAVAALLPSAPASTTGP